MRESDFKLVGLIAYRISQVLETHILEEASLAARLETRKDTEEGRGQREHFVQRQDSDDKLQLPGC